MNRTGKRFTAQNSKTLANPPRVSGSTQNCAGPPTRSVVCLESGSYNLTSPAPITSRSCNGDLEIFDQFGGFFVNISSSKTQDQISRFRDSSDLPVQNASFRHIDRRGMVVCLEGGYNRVA